jgi:hypothetical protein
MSDHTEFLPRFQASIRAKPKDRCFVLSCEIVGDEVGFRTSERQFPNIGSILEALRIAEIPPARYETAINALDGHAISDFAVSLNEAQRLAIIQTDSTE